MRKIIIGFVLLVLVFGSGFFTSQFAPSLLNFEKKSETSVSGVLEKVVQISQLDTVEMYFNEILDHRSALYLNGTKLPFTEKSFIFTVKAKVQSGIDLSTLTEEDIQIIDKKIIITVDKAKITSKEIIEYKAYHETDGVGNPVTTADTLETLNDFNDRLEQQALDNGIIEKAQDNAKLFLENFLMLLGFEEVVINFAE